MAGEGNPCNPPLTAAQINAQLLSYGLTLSDNKFSLTGSSDATKIGVFELDGNSAGTTRTYTLPNATGTLSMLSLAETQSGAKTLTGGLIITTTNLTITDKDVVLSATTGTKIGTATSQKLGFWNVTPIIQPAGAGQAAAAAQSQTSLTDNTGGSVSTTLAAITAGAAYAQADMTAAKDALASIAAELALIKTDVANIKTLQDATRTALVNSGIMKGAA
jgi:hypothetical protein